MHESQKSGCAARHVHTAGTQSCFRPTGCPQLRKDRARLRKRGLQGLSFSSTLVNSKQITGTRLAWFSACHPKLASKGSRTCRAALNATDTLELPLHAPLSLGEEPATDDAADPRQCSMPGLLILRVCNGQKQACDGQQCTGAGVFAPRTSCFLSGN